MTAPASPGRQNPGPRLIRGDEGGPLSRRLWIIRMVRLQEFVHRASSLAYRRISGLSAFECRVLARVCETPPLSINELAEHLGRGVAQVSRTVKKLAAAGLVSRTAKGGGPGVSITPTRLGQVVYQPLVEHTEHVNAELAAGLSAEELAVLEKCLAMMTDNALARLAREQDLAAGDPGPDDED